MKKKLISKFFSQVMTLSRVMTRKRGRARRFERSRRPNRVAQEMLGRVKNLMGRVGSGRVSRLFTYLTLTRSDPRKSLVYSKFRCSVPTKSRRGLKGVEVAAGLATRCFFDPGAFCRSHGAAQPLLFERKIKRRHTPPSGTLLVPVPCFLPRATFSRLRRFLL